MHVGPKFNGVAVQNVDAFLREVEKVRDERDVYFCMSQQRDAEPNGTKMLAKRSQLDALLLSSVFADIDVGADKAKKGKGYATQQDALAALKSFLVATKLPRPSAIVASGSGGFHIHWFSDKPLIPALWQSYANALQALADQHGFLIDPVVTRDSARVLRVPDTLNWKHDPPRPVRLLHLGKSYNLAEVFAPVASAPVAPRTSAPGRAGRLSLPARFKGRVAKIEGIEDREPINSLNPLPILQGCGFLRTALKTGGANYDNLQWNLTTLCATFMEKGNVFAHKFAEGYTGDSRNPGYSYETTQALWERKLGERDAKGLGFPSCSAIRNSGCKSCVGCPHFAAGKSPLNLAFVARGVGALPGREVSKLPVGASGSLPEWCSIKDGYITALVDIKLRPFVASGGDPDEEVETRELRLFLNEIIGEGWANHNPQGINFTVRDDVTRTHDAFVPMTSFTKTKIQQALLDARVRYNPSVPPALLEKFMISWIDRMNNFVAARAASPFGWQEKGDGSKKPIGFSYGGLLFKPGVKEVTPITDPKMKAQYTPCGKREAWDAAAKLIFDQNKPELELIIAASFAGPLMRIIDHPGAHLAVWSSDSGAHKTTASQIAAAVWGHPEDTREKKGSSWKGAVKRLEDTTNLTAFWDDVQNDEEMKRLVDTALALCQGSAGTKLMQNRQYHESGHWQTLCASSSNMSVVDWLTKKEGSSDFRIARVFEVQHVKTMGAGVVKTTEAMDIIGNLNRNYGQVGLAYAELLANNIDEAFDYIKEEGDSFSKDVLTKLGVPEDSANRYWLVVCVTVLAAIKLANDGLKIGFHYEAIRERLVQAFVDNFNRKVEENLVGGSDRNTENVLGRFLTYAGDNMTVWSVDPPKRGGVKTSTTHFTPQRGATVIVHAITAKREIRISRDAFKKWCGEMNVSLSSTIRGAKQHFNVDTSHKYILAAGTEYQRRQEDVIVIPVPEGSPFEVFLLAPHLARKPDEPTS